MTLDAVHPTTVRRKIEGWLTESEKEKDSRHVLALRARPLWQEEPLQQVGGTRVRIVACPTPLVARAAINDRAEDEKLVLLTELTDAELGDGLLAHVSLSQIRSVDRWDLVKQMFHVVNYDPTLADSAMGGGRWVADALARYAPPDGWPTPTGTFLTRDHALRCLAAQLLGIDRDRLDSAGLVQWTTDAPRVLQFSQLPPDVIDGISTYLTEITGSLAVPAMSAVRAGHGIEVIPLGLLAAALWPDQPSSAVGTEIAVARTRSEPYFGGTRLTGEQAKALRTASEAWVLREIDIDAEAPHAAQRMIANAEELAKKIDAVDLLRSSDLLPTAFTLRLRDFAAALRRAVKAKQLTRAALEDVHRELAAVERHRGAGNRRRVETARMAVRLLRWLATPDALPPRTLFDALLRQVREDGWVDRARLDVFAGDADLQVAEAYRLLHHTVNSKRARHDREFAELLAADTAIDAEPGELLRVEDLLVRIVDPILAHRRVLLLVLDGMSVAAATELAESITRSGVWLELTRGGRSRTGVLAALPTVTEVSRCSLLSGRMAVGQASIERKAFTARYPKGVLLHKGSLRAGAGNALDPEIVAALGDADTPIVAAVVNTIDDALSQGDPGTTVWSAENVSAVADLLAHAHDRVVILVSDHGHVVDRGPDAIDLPSPAKENRWRPVGSPVVEGEIAIRGPRVGLGDGHVVLPWREEVHYGTRRAGYHGGASSAEVVIPLLVLSAGEENAIPGWSGAPVASPSWWREERTGTVVLAARADGKISPESADDIPALFEVTPEVPAVQGNSTLPNRSPLAESLLSSETYRRRRGTRAPLPDDRVAALLDVLVARGGRATLETLAAQAGVPAHRIAGTVTALRKLLQVEGYPVVEMDPDGQTVKLDRDLLIEQFGLERL
ncbi:BREX-2 system phosphatase PglZ [Nocardia terpenica]|uniref:Alkaline phosphatase n=1 Tax=Nocardia terpenica TaxID=455432 RepID=A0A291RHR7_9NOCA|nr:BREX-2 system phosphatase PglZ [Nocardia terpenica]ATL66674.1 alkaline phosphatase [Nocardia terpenica]